MAALELVPRAPISMNDRTGTLDQPDKYANSVKAWRAAAKEEAVATLKMNPEYEFIRDYMDMIEGRYWNKRRPSYRSKYFDNCLAEARSDTLCALTDIRPAPEIFSDDQNPQYVRQAQIGKKIIEYEWSNLDLDIRLEAAVDHALLSVGYWKIGATMPGAMHIIPCGMDCVLPIQPGVDLQDSTAVLYRVYKPMARVKSAYGITADKLDREVSSGFSNSLSSNYPMMGYIPNYTFNPLEPTSRYQPQGRGNIVMPRDTGPFPSVEVEEYWIDDTTINESSGDILVKDPRLDTGQHNYWYRVPKGQRLFPRKRLLVMVGDTILYDGPSPFWHGLYPFAQLILSPAVWRPGGISLYRNLAPLQIAKNVLGAGMMDLTARAVEPQFAFVDGAVDDTSFRQFFQDMPGAKLRMNAGSTPGASARYLDPPQLPAYVGGFWDRVDRAFDKQSGAIDVTGMMAKKQMPGGDTIEQARDSAGTAFRLKSRHMEPFVRAAATQMLSCVFQYYSREQRMKILGPTGITIQDFDYDPGTMIPWTVPKEEHWKKFKIRVAAGSMHGGKRDRDKMLAVSLFQRNAISRRKLLEILEFPDIDEILQQIQEENPVVPPEGVGKGSTPRLNRNVRTGNPF